MRPRGLKGYHNHIGGLLFFFFFSFFVPQFHRFKFVGGFFTVHNFFLFLTLHSFFCYLLTATHEVPFLIFAGARSLSPSILPHSLCDDLYCTILDDISLVYSTLYFFSISVPAHIIFFCKHEKRKKFSIVAV